MSTQYVGRYEILGELGRGGMATVYHARDPHFDREVAIKVLPREFLHDATFRTRFLREGKLIAAMSHTAIVPVFDFGEDNGQPFLVMRYMAGGSLADRLHDGPLDLPQSIDILRQLAPALDTIHTQGIIHRDLKPANILFDGADQPSLADFGIAKLAESSATLTRGLIGTPAYMSPEQVSGDQEVDGRSDLYSLGVILFQMLSGDVPFRSDTPHKVMFKHVYEAVPKLSTLELDLPRKLDAVLAKAMAKAPEDRYQTAAQLVGALEDVLAKHKEKPKRAPKREPSPPAITTQRTIDEIAPLPESTVSAPRAWKFPIWILALLLIPLIIAAGVIVLPRLGGAASGTATPDAAGEPSSQPTPLDGTAAVLDSTDPAPTSDAGLSPTVVLLGLPGSPVTSNAEWTPLVVPYDGVQMALVPAGCFQMGSDGSLEGSADESPVHQVCFDQPFWLDQFEVTNSQFNAFGGQAEIAGNATSPDVPRGDLNWTEAVALCQLRGARLPTEAEWEYAARGPDALVYPWGEQFIDANAEFGGQFSRPGLGQNVGIRPAGASWVGAQDMVGSAYEWVNDWYSDTYYGTLGDSAINPPGPESGTLKVVRSGSYPLTEDLRAANRSTLDPSEQLSRNGVRCARDWSPDDPLVVDDTPTPTAQPSTGGEIVYVSTLDGNSNIYVMDASGANPVRLTDDPAEDLQPEWSPDGTRIAFSSNRGGSFDIYIMDSDGSNVTQITTSDTNDSDPTWSPDGTQIAFASSVNGGGSQIFLMGADGSNVRLLSADIGTTAIQPAWSPLGNPIAYLSYENPTSGIFTINADGSSLTHVIGGLEFSVGNPAWSPDGILLAFSGVSSVTNTLDLFIVGADGTGAGAHTIFMPDIEQSPSWSPDGEYIVFAARTVEGFDIYILPLGTGETTRLTTTSGDDTDPELATHTLSYFSCRTDLMYHYI